MSNDVHSTVNTKSTGDNVWSSLENPNEFLQELASKFEMSSILYLLALLLLFLMSILLLNNAFNLIKNVFGIINIFILFLINVCNSMLKLFKYIKNNIKNIIGIIDHKRLKIKLIDFNKMIDESRLDHVIARIRYLNLKNFNERVIIEWYNSKPVKDFINLNRGFVQDQWLFWEFSPNFMHVDMLSLSINQEKLRLVKDIFNILANWSGDIRLNKLQDSAISAYLNDSHNKRQWLSYMDSKRIVSGENTNYIISSKKLYNILLYIDRNATGVVIYIKFYESKIKLYKALQ